LPRGCVQSSEKETSASTGHTSRSTGTRAASSGFAAPDRWPNLGRGRPAATAAFTAALYAWLRVATASK
jgi:hypothetical protein